MRGATLKELHSSYAYGSGLTAIFSSVAAFNTVALAAVFMVSTHRCKGSSRPDRTPCSALRPVEPCRKT